MRNLHELGECWPSQEVLPSPKGYGKRDLTDGHCCCTRDCTMERSSPGA
jgi:hypothetical protein